MVIQLTKAAFLDKIWAFDKQQSLQKKDGTPCVVFFYIDNELCEQQYEILKHISEIYKRKISFYKINALEEQLLTADLGIRKVPALLFIPANKSPGMSFGVFSEKTLQKAFYNIFKI